MSGGKIMSHLFSLKNIKDIIQKLISGITTKEIQDKKKILDALVTKNNQFICNPLPNLYFTRDISVIIDQGVCFTSMHTEARRRETLFMEYIMKYHPEFQKLNIPHWYNRISDTSIEGGDILVLNENLLAVGISQRTHLPAIKKLASRIFNIDETKVKTILAFDIPNSRSFMHLDTVFTQIDHDKFIIHSGIEESLRIYAITSGTNGLVIQEESMILQRVLEKYLDRKITIIKCKHSDPVTNIYTHRNNGLNTLAIKPGNVIVYECNHVTNQILQDHGIITHEIKGTELSRGCGGPRCMSMPLERSL